MARSLRSLAGFCRGEYGDFVLERNIITTTLMLIPNGLHWGRPKAAEAGEVGRGQGRSGEGEGGKIRAKRS